MLDPKTRKFTKFLHLHKLLTKFSQKSLCALYNSTITQAIRKIFKKNINLKEPLVSAIISLLPSA